MCENCSGMHTCGLDECARAAEHDVTTTSYSQKSEATPFGCGGGGDEGVGEDDGSDDGNGGDRPMTAQAVPGAWSVH